MFKIEHLQVPVTASLQKGYCYSLRVPLLNGHSGFMNTQRSYEDMVAAEVRAIAGRKDISRAELAERTGISLSTIRRYIWSRDDGGPIPLDSLHLISTALGVTTPELLRLAEANAPEAEDMPQEEDSTPRRARKPDARRIRSTERQPRIVD